MKLKLIYFTILILNLLISRVNSQSLSGMSGMLTIPTGNIINDGEVYLGVNYLPEVELTRYNFNHSSLTPFISIGFLPFLEISVRSTYPVDGFEYSATGDRMPSLRIKIFSETNVLPSTSIGLHDFVNVFGGTEAQHFNSLYIVASKRLISTNGIVLTSTVGYGSDIIKANGHQFVGLFGGLEATISFAKSYFDISLISEYDGKKFNAGSRIKLLNHVNILFGLFDLKYASGGISFSFNM